MKQFSLSYIVLVIFYSGAAVISVQHLFKDGDYSTGKSYATMLIYYMVRFIVRLTVNVVRILGGYLRTDGRLLHFRRN